MAKSLRNQRLPRGQRAVAPRVTISESDGVRYLHFGTEWVQGAMRIARPFALALEYQQQMMAPLLFLPQPARIVQLGLGAAALAKFCWCALPAARVVAVEISANVVAAARQWFRLPPDDDRLEVVLADAREFVAEPRRRRCADWLQVDLYDAAARGPVYDDVGFYRACRRALAVPGVAAFNLFGRGFEPSFDAIAQAFDDRALVLAEADAGNRVVLAFTGPPVAVDFASLYARARRIEAEFRLPARKWVSGLRAENGLSDRLCV
ncbi:MAG TPA: spermidine synthase [Burkholderiaceae bacterium]|nr:spermidine synthase [Burkholderiaceae bacterium]